MKKKNIAVFASGNGSNFVEINKNILNKNINGKINILISNNPNCGAVKYAIKNNIPVEIVNDFRFPQENQKIKEYENILNKNKIDLILLAGFMKKIPNNLIKIYRNKIMNIHPSLLPDFGGLGFYGIKVHEEVIKSKSKLSGATIHFVNENYDKGSIIFQKSTTVLSIDDPISLSNKVLKIEHEIYPKIVKCFCEDKIKIINKKVIIRV